VTNKNKLAHSFKSAWQVMDKKETQKAMNFCEDYKTFLNNKTERTCAADIVKRAQKRGFVSIESVINTGKPLKEGQKIFALNREKSVILFVIGEKKLEQGMHIVGSHIDAPRLDLKPFPLYEDSEMAFLKTHYYGGIKKYQWTTIPLEMHGVVFTEEKK